MAAKTPGEIRADLVERLEKAYEKIDEKFSDIGKNAKELEEELKEVNKRVDEFSESLFGVIKKFKEIRHELKDIDLLEQRQINWFKKSNDLLKESIQIIKGNRDATADQLRSVQDQLKYRLKEKGWLKNHQAELRKINDEIKEREKLERKVIHAYGIMGNAVETLSKELPGPLAKFMDLDGAAKKMKEVAEAGGNAFDAIKEGGKSVGRSLVKSFMDPANAVNLIVSALKFAYEAALALDKQTVDISKNMSLSYEGAEAMRGQMSEIRNLSGDIYMSVGNQVEAQSQLNDALGTASVFSKEMAQGQIDMTKKMGLQVEEAEKLSLLFAVNNQSQDEGTLAIAKQVTGLYKQKGIALDLRKTMADVAKVNGQLRIQYGNNTEQIAKAVVLSKSLGMSIEQSNDAAKKLLNFEDSIAAELEAELLTGKELNLEEARSLALAGKTAEAQALVMQEVGGINDFMGRNVFEQESLAAAAGMTVDEFSNALVQQDNLNKLAPKQREELEKMAQLLRDQGKETEANNLLNQAGDADRLAASLERTSVEQDFAQIVQDIKEAFSELAGGPMKEILLALKEWMMNGDNIRGLFKSIEFTAGAIAGLVTGRLLGGLVASTVQFVLQRRALEAQRNAMAQLLAAERTKSALSAADAVAKVTAAEASTLGSATPLILGGIAAVLGVVGGLIALQDGAINPNGGLVISKPAGDMLVPVAQGIKGDYAYLSTNGPQQTQDAMVTPAAAGAVMAPTNNNAELVAAMQAIAFNTSVSARKEFDFDTFGTTIATKTVGISA
jgi:hypothetical protein